MMAGSRVDVRDMATLRCWISCTKAVLMASTSQMASARIITAAHDVRSSEKITQQARCTPARTLHHGMRPRHECRVRRRGGDGDAEHRLGSTAVHGGTVMAPASRGHWMGDGG